MEGKEERSGSPPNFTSKRTFRMWDLPRIAQAQPSIRNLNLPAVANLLIEYSKFHNGFHSRWPGLSVSVRDSM